MVPAPVVGKLALSLLNCLCVSVTISDSIHAGLFQGSLFCSVDTHDCSFVSNLDHCSVTGTRETRERVLQVCVCSTTEDQKYWPVASPGPSASLLPKRGGASLGPREPRRRPESAARESRRRDGMTHLPLPSWRDGGATSDSELQRPPGQAASTELPSEPPPPGPWPRMEPGQMVEAQAWDPSPRPHRL